MAVYELKNEEIRIQINSRGAELKSLKKQSTGEEFMWCGDPTYWNRTSPILFPFVGGLRGKEYRTKGKTYSMTQHGFARDMEFTLLSQGKEEIWFAVSSSEETLQKFPYAFLLKLGYRLVGSKVEVLWQVENPGEEILPFSIGGHPAFNCPVKPEENQKECSVFFEGVEEVVSTRIGESGLATDCMDVYGLFDGRLPLTENLFDHDALVLEGNQTHQVSLCHKDGTPYVTVTMEDMPLFGVWAPAGGKAPFVCIEPWCGRCDNEQFEGTLKEREWSNTLKPGEVWKASYTIMV